jgi:choline dehydrogenase-like flavoprotein
MSRFTQTRKTHVIIGGGASGLMLTNMLLHYGDNVILVERGDEHTDSGHTDLDKAIDWGSAALREKSSDEGSNRTTEMQRALSDRQILYPQGYGLGGTSNINACIWSGGNPTVFNEYWPYFWNSVRMTDWLEIVRLAIEPVHVQAAKGSAKNTLLRGIQFSRKFLLDDDDQTEFENDCYKYEDVNEEELGDDDVEDEIHNSVWSHPSQATYLATLNSNETRYTSNRLKLGNLLRTHKGDGKLTLHSNTRAEFVVFQGTTAVAVAVSPADTKAGGIRVTKFTPSNTPIGTSSDTTSVMEQSVLHNSDSTSTNMDRDMTNTYKFDLIKPSGGGEIILCAGVIETPRILIASGLKGTVNSHPASNCGRINNVESNSQSKKGRDRSRRSNKPKFYNQRSSSSKYRSYSQKSPLPNLGGIGSQLQDHVVVPVLAIGNWCFTKEGDFLSVLGLKYDGKSEFHNNDSDVLNFNNFGSSSLSEPINTHSIYENESMNFAPAVYPAGNRSRSSSNVMERMKLVDKKLQEISARGWIDNIVRVITFSLLCIKYMCFTLWWDIFSGIWIDKYVIPLQHMVKSISAQFTANGVHGWIDLDSKGNVLDRDKYGSQMPYAQLMFIDGGCGAGYIPELLLPRMKYPLVYAHYLRPLLFRMLTYLCSMTIVKTFLRFFVFGFLVCLTNPQSKGRVYPNHEDPQGPLLMDLNLLSSRKDKKILHNALNTAHHLLELSRQKDGLSYLELLPGVLFNYARPDDYFDLYTSMFSTTFFHACGTCAMSTHLDRADNQHPPLEKATTADTVLESTEEDEDTITSDNIRNDNKEVEKLGLGSPVSTTDTVTTSGTGNSNIENDSPFHKNTNMMAATAEHPEIDREGNGVLSDIMSASEKSGSISSNTQRGGKKCKSEISTDGKSGKDHTTSILARDPTAVVDYKLRVLGVNGLRVADASVMPHIPSGPISATCMAMGAACAEFLHEVESNDGKPSIGSSYGE